MSASAFSSICRSLSKLQVRLLQRLDSPVALSTKAVELLRANSNSLDVVAENVSHVPVFLRSCSTLFKKVPETQHLALLDVLPGVHRVASQYVNASYGDVNDASSVLRSIMGLDEVQKQMLRQLPSASPPPISSFREILRFSYTHAYHEWQRQDTPVHTISVLALLRGAAEVHASDFRFSSPKPDQRGVLPLKLRVEMEARMQRVPVARELMNALKVMKFNRLDAGMCLTSLADLGFYDADLCNLVCEVLHSTHAMVTSQQFSQVLYSLGVLQHRHVYQRFFSGLVVPQECNAEGIRQHLFGLAMLQQPPHCERKLMDGIFLHAMRGQRQRKRKELRGRGEQRVATHHQELPYSWYVDVLYGLSCIDICSHKLKLMASRQLRGVIPKMTTLERCKFLYGIGPANDPSVADDLKGNWENKVGRALSLAIHKLEDISIAEGPQVTHALRYCGVEKHPRLPPAELENSSHRRENPVEVLLRAWAHTPKERIIHLTEQIDSANLRVEGGETPTAQLAKIIATLVKACPSPSPRDQYRFASLCATVDEYASTFSAEEALIVLDGLYQLGLSQYYDATVQHLLDQLWVHRSGLSQNQLDHCRGLMVQLGDNERASKLSQ